MKRRLLIGTIIGEALMFGIVYFDMADGIMLSVSLVFCLYLIYVFLCIGKYINSRLNVINQWLVPLAISYNIEIFGLLLINVIAFVTQSMVAMLLLYLWEIGVNRIVSVPLSMLISYLVLKRINFN